MSKDYCIAGTPPLESNQQAEDITKAMHSLEFALSALKQVESGDDPVVGLVARLIHKEVMSSYMTTTALQTTTSRKWN